MELMYINQEEFKISPQSFLPYLKTLEKQLALMEGVLNVIFVNDAYIQALNKAYRGQDKPTDVLSFNYEGEETGVIGEIYISVETAKKQAEEHLHAFEDELIKLIVHGILHIHGYDHEEDEDYKKMYVIEKAVLGEIAGPFIE